jgi:hypothetical protein
MASKQTFEELLQDAPQTPAVGTVSLVGALERAEEASKFVLNLQNGTAVVLDTACVKGHAVLGQSAGQVMVRIDIDADKAPWLREPEPSPWLRRREPIPQPWFRHFDPQPSPWSGHFQPIPVPWVGRSDPVPSPWVTSQGEATPFSLATARQAPDFAIRKSPVLDTGHTTPFNPDVKNADDNTLVADLFLSHSNADLPI